MVNAQAPPTVLLVDESASIRMLLRLTLETQPFRVVEASDTNQAWALIAVERPALMILEPRLPGPDPLELCRALRRAARTAATRIVILTTLVGEDNRHRALAAGADLVLTKPFRPLELLAEVERLLAPPPGRRRQASFGRRRDLGS